MTFYLIDEDQMKILKEVEAWLYGNTGLRSDFLDKKRDMANKMNYVLDKVQKEGSTNLSGTGFVGL